MWPLSCSCLILPTLWLGSTSASLDTPQILNLYVSEYLEMAAAVFPLSPVRRIMSSLTFFRVNTVRFASDFTVSAIPSIASDFGKPLILFQVKGCDTGGPRAGAGPFDLPAQGSNPTQILQVMYCTGGTPDVQLVT